VRVHASIEPLEWENAFFGVNSAIVRIDPAAALLTAERLQAWSRVQAKIPAAETAWLDALQRLGFSLVEGEVDLALPVTPTGEQAGAEIAQPADIRALRQLAAVAFAQSSFRAPWYASDVGARFYAEWIGHAVHATFDYQCLLLRAANVGIRG